MTDIVVRDINGEVINRLRLRAKLKGHSLAQEVRHILTAAARWIGPRLLHKHA
jgi:plasmid stability protein